MTKKAVVTEGGWIWWLDRIKEAHPERKLDYKALLQKYIAGAKWEDV